MLNFSDFLQQTFEQASFFVQGRLFCPKKYLLDALKSSNEESFTIHIPPLIYVAVLNI